MNELSWPSRSGGMRVGFLASHPIQYNTPLLAYLSGADDIDAVGLFLTDFSMRGAVDRQFGRVVQWDIDLLDGYEHHFVGPSWTTDVPGGFLSLRGTGLRETLPRLKLDALVVNGHNHLASIRAVNTAWRMGLPVLYRSDSNRLLYGDGLRERVRNRVLAPLFSRVAGFLACGRRNHEYYRWMGIPEERIFPFPFAVDNVRLRRAAQQGKADRGSIRRALGLAPDVPVVVFASKLMGRKRAGDVIAAAQQLAAQGTALQVLIIGTGEEEERLRQQADAGAVPVIFGGFRNQSELPGLLAASDIFVLPSENEPFGLVVNEAMCAGLPIVCSRGVGAAADLVRHGENGFQFEAADIAALAQALSPLLASAELRASMGAASERIINHWSYAEDLDGLRQALARIVPASARA